MNVILLLTLLIPWMFRYFMYYYPWFSFAAGCALISGLQILCYLSIAVVSF